MTPEQFASARATLGLSCYELGELLGLTGGREVAGKRVRQIEAGTWRLTGPIAALIGALLDGWRPGQASDTDSRALRRMLAAVTGLLAEVDCVKAVAIKHRDAGRMNDALADAGKAEGIARAANAMSHTLKELAG